MMFSRQGEPCWESIPFYFPFLYRSNRPCAMEFLYSSRLDDPIIIFATTQKNRENLS